MADFSSGSTQLAVKAGNRRARVAIFGGTLNKKQGRRGPVGKGFNRTGNVPKRFVNPSLTKKKAGGAGVSFPAQVDDFGSADD